MRAPVLGLGCVMLATPAAWHPATAQPPGQVLVHKGVCEASAAVAFPRGGFGGHSVVANDEDNTLRVYAADRSGDEAGGSLSLDGVLGVSGTAGDSDTRKADIEGAAWLGGRIYWIGSHARGRKDGEVRPNQRRLLATTASAGPGGEVVLAPSGPRAELTEALRRTLTDPGSGLGLRRDPIGGAEADESLGSESGGLNIEGLAAGADGTSLLIGLRGPLSDGQAIVIPLENPAALVDRGEAPRLGTPVRLDLQGRGIRSLEYVEARREYLVLAGPTDDTDRPGFGLYAWNGHVGASPRAVLADPGALAGLVRDEEFRPEAMVADPEGAAVRLLSDDGDRRIPPGGRKCSSDNQADPQFRSVVLPLLPVAR